jgi:hypothetical protein
MTSFSTLAARSFCPFEVSSGGVYLAALAQLLLLSSSEVEDLIRCREMWFVCSS